MNNHRQNDDDDALSAMLSRSNRQRTAVYSGKKSTAFYSKDEPLPSLKDMCILILQGIYSTGNLVFPQTDFIQGKMKSISDNFNLFYRKC